MNYSYKPTTHGRAVMAACMALEKPLHITRVAFGSGKVDEETNLADIHQLLSYISDGAVAERRHEEDRFYLTIQFANSEHKDVKTFLLSEFMVFAEDPDTGAETDLLYGTLGDYRQPVPAYNPAFPPSVFNFPLTLILSDEINVSVTAPAGLATWEDMAQMAGQLSSRRHNITIPVNGWEADPDKIRALRRDIPVENARESMVPQLTILPAGEQLAEDCGIAPFVQSLDGVIRVWADSTPAAPIPASLELQGDCSGLVIGDDEMARMLTQEQADGRYLKLGGGTMTGPLSVPVPTAGGHAVNRTYADTRYLQLSGGDMAGILDMQNHALTGIPDPVSPADAVNYQTLVKMIVGLGPLPVITVSGSGNKEQKTLAVIRETGAWHGNAMLYISESVSLPEQWGIQNVSIQLPSQFKHPGGDWSDVSSPALHLEINGIGYDFSSPSSNTPIVYSASFSTPIYASSFLVAGYFKVSVG